MLTVGVWEINVYIFEGFRTRFTGLCKNSGAKETFYDCIKKKIRPPRHGSSRDTTRENRRVVESRKGFACAR